jgi:hypothetical protein
VQLSVRPDDLMSTAGAVRGVHASLVTDRQEFAAAAARLTDGLGAQAVDSAAQTVAAVVAAVEGVEDDLAAVVRGLGAVAAGYAQVDGHARSGG